MLQWTKHPINTLDRATKITDALAADGVTNSDSEAVRMVSESLRAFAMATPQEQGSYKQLSEVRERARREISELSQTNSMSGRKMHKSTPEDYPEFVNVELYDTLRGYTRCQCQLSGEAAAIEHEAKLCLRSQVHINQDLVDFDLHFWSSPHWERTNQNCHWQQLRMHVPR